MTAAICYSREDWTLALSDGKILPSCREFLDALRLNSAINPFYITGQALVIDTFRALLITEYKDLYDQVEFFMSDPFEKPDLQVLDDGMLYFVNHESYRYADISTNILSILLGCGDVLYDKNHARDN